MAVCFVEQVVHASGPLGGPPHTQRAATMDGGGVPQEECAARLREAILEVIRLGGAVTQTPSGPDGEAALWFDRFIRYFIDGHGGGEGGPGSGEPDASAPDHRAAHDDDDDILFFVRHDAPLGDAASPGDRIYVKRRPRLRGQLPPLESGPLDWQCTFYLNLISHAKTHLRISTFAPHGGEHQDPPGVEQDGSWCEEDGSNGRQRRVAFQRTWRVFASATAMGAAARPPPKGSEWKGALGRRQPRGRGRDDLQQEESRAFHFTFPMIHFSLDELDEAIALSPEETLSIELSMADSTRPLLGQDDDGIVGDAFTPWKRRRAASSGTDGRIILFQGAVSCRAISSVLAREAPAEGRGGAQGPPMRILMNSPDGDAFAQIQASATAAAEVGGEGAKSARSSVERISAALLDYVKGDVLHLARSRSASEEDGLAQVAPEGLHVRLTFVQMHWTAIVSRLLDHFA